MTATRPPPRILFVHDGTPNPHHVSHLLDAGLSVADVHAHDAVNEAMAFHPDIIVLDFGADGDVVAALKRHPETERIPVIALVELQRS